MNTPRWLVVVLIGMSFLLVRLSRADDSKSAADALNRGEKLLIAGDLDGAIAAYSEAIRLEPKNAEAYRKRARTYAVKAAPERFPYLWTCPRGVLDRQRTTPRSRHQTLARTR